MLRSLLALVTLGLFACLVGCVDVAPRGHWSIAQGSVVTTSLDIDVEVTEKSRVDTTTTTWHLSVPACSAVSNHPEIVAVTPGATGEGDVLTPPWFVWGVQPGLAVITLTGCGGETAAIYADVSPQ